VQDADRALDTMNFTEIKDKPCRIMWSQRDPTLRNFGFGNIFIKNLAPSIDNKSLFDTFSVFGNILSCKVITDENAVSKGFGYVHYETAEAAQEAIKKLDGFQLEGQAVNVLLYSRKTDRVGNNDWTNLYVKQFPLSWSDEVLNKLVSAFGPTTSVCVTKDEAGKSKGFMFVNFETHEAANAAFEDLNGKVVEEDGTTYTLFASQAQKKSDRVRELKRQLELAKQEKILKLQGMNLFVKNLDDTVTDDLLRESFAPFGTITSARVMRDESNGNVSRGFGFVCYSSPEEATRAVSEMNYKVINSKPITVTLHQRKEVRREQLLATFEARAGRSNMVGGGFMGQGVGPYNMMYGGGMGGRGGFMGGRGGAGRGPFPAGRGGNAFPMPNYAMQQGGPRGMPQGIRPPGAQMGFAPNMMLQQGRGGGRLPGAGGRGAGRGMMAGANMMAPQGGRMPPMQGGVKFNVQARNQPMHMGMMQGGPMSMPQPMQMQMQPQMGGQEPLDEILLAQAEPSMQKHMIGERLYPLIVTQQPNYAGKITGMLLEMDNAELLHLIESPEALANKIEEALDVLRKHQSANSEQ
jgi:polyadenylate-binding protein